MEIHKLAFFAALLLLIGAPCTALAQKPMQEIRASRIILPSISLKEASFDSALDLVLQKANQAAGGDAKINLVRAYPKQQGETQITLSLSRVPLTEVFRYLGSLANLEFQYEQHAIVIKPPDSAAPAQSPAAGG